MLKTPKFVRSNKIIYEVNKHYYFIDPNGYDIYEGVIEKYYEHPFLIKVFFPDYETHECIRSKSRVLMMNRENRAIFKEQEKVRLSLESETKKAQTTKGKKSKKEVIKAPKKVPHRPTNPKTTKKVSEKTKSAKSVTPEHSEPIVAPPAAEPPTPAPPVTPPAPPVTPPAPPVTPEPPVTPPAPPVTPPAPPVTPPVPPVTPEPSVPIQSITGTQTMAAPTDISISATRNEETKEMTFNFRISFKDFI